MFYQPSTGTQFQSTAEFRLAHPHLSCGRLDNELERNAAGLFALDVVIPPHDRELEELTPDPISEADGRYRQTYTVQPREMDPDRRRALQIRRFDAVLTNHYNETAQARRYESWVTCALRAGKPGPFQAEGDAFFQWMETCNAQAYALMAAVLSGQRQVPASAEAFLAEFPPMVWPE
jgi:hypothetical protein